MEATWVAAARGHAVTTFGMSSQVGGKTRLRSLLPGGEALSSVYDYQHAAAQKAGARFELGGRNRRRYSCAQTLMWSCLACGSTMVAPRWLPPECADIVSDLRIAIADLIGINTRQSGTAVIFDMDHTDGTYAAAELLRTLFDRVIIMTPRDSIAQDIAMVTRQGILRRMHEQRIEMLLHAEPVWTGRRRRRLPRLRQYLHA